jgi:xanthine dehydrogenase YagS FAD-binding subunit
MIRFPTTPDEATAAGGLYRAGGTDLQERRRHRITTGDLTDLRDLGGLDHITTERKGSLLLGALTPVAAIASDSIVRSSYPGLALAAGGLATPQIRARATLGGNLAQEVRCWYFRSPRFRCLKQGGSTCHARAGDHLYHSCFDQGPCIAPHPSTLAMALMAYDATVLVTGSDEEEEERSIEALVGDGRQPTQTNALSGRALITAVRLPPPIEGERAAYFRAISRSRAEWPLVEVLARLQIEEGTITAAWVAMGGVANTPLRLPGVEAALTGQRADTADLAAAAQLAAEGAEPLPMTGYKVDLIPGTVLETLERALSRGEA